MNTTKQRTLDGAKTATCPFCGSPRIGCHSKKSGRKSGYQCRCLNCGVGQNRSFHPSIEQAFQAWNTRHHSDEALSATADSDAWLRKHDAELVRKIGTKEWAGGMNDWFMGMADRIERGEWK